MKTVEELIEKIDSDIDAAFDILDEIFKESNTTYDSLCDKYTDPPQGFSLTTFTSQLKRFVKRNKKIRAYFDGLALFEETTGNDDKTYKLLYDLDFEHQIECFRKILKNSCPLHSFVIRGQESYGQSWLCNRFLSEYSYPVHETIIFDPSKYGSDLLYIARKLNEKITANYNASASNDLLQELMALEYGLVRRIETSSQFIIFSNAYDLVSKPEFTKFYECLNKTLQVTRTLKGTHKCIFLFVENSVNPYKLKSDCCLFTKKMIEEDKSIRKIYSDLMLYDLDENTAISREEFKAWAEEQESSIFDKFKDFIKDDAAYEAVLEKTDNGNPEKVLAFICEIMNWNYLELIDKHPIKC